MSTRTPDLPGRRVLLVGALSAAIAGSIAVASDLAPGAVPAIACKPLTQFVSVDESTAWAVCGGPRRHRLLRFDPREKRLVAEIAIKEGVNLFAVQEDAVWVTFGNMRPGLQRIDPSTNDLVATSRIQGGFDGPLVSLAATRDALWLTTAEGWVLRFDPSTGETVATIHIGLGSARAAIGKEDTLWVLSTASGVLSRIDAQASRVVETIPIGVSCENVVAPCHFGPVYGAGSVWIGSFYEGTVSRIDPDLNRVVATTPVGPAPRYLEFADGNVWVFVGGSLLKIDPSTSRVVGRVADVPPGASADLVERLADAGPRGVTPVEEGEFDPPLIYTASAAGTFPRRRPKDAGPGPEGPVYRMQGKRVDLEFLTPPVLRVLVDRDETTPHEKHMEIARFTPGMDFFRWGRCGTGDEPLVFIQAVPKIRKISNAAGIAWGDLAALFNPKDRVLEPPFLHMTLSRDAIDVPPVDPARPCGEFKIRVLYAEGDTKWKDRVFGCYGSFAYPPDVFRSGSSFVVEVFTEGSSVPEAFDISDETIARIRADLEPYFELPE